MGTSKKIVVLTGAGISAESGLRTFRDADGLWENEPVRIVATPEGFESDPERVITFYNKLRNSLKNVEPNAAHHALVKLEEKYGDDFLLITQNVDDLHQRAGSKRVIAMHGELLKVRCLGHGEHVMYCTENQPEKCPECGAKMRPHIVWFGEIPFEMKRIQKALTQCDLFAYIGTSGVVYPAAGFRQMAKSSGAYVVCLNLEEVDGGYTDEFIQGKAGEIVPKWVEKLS
ncbi:MAG: NAD-dependent deacylase [Fibromonadaceae bacterium]|jgi:NAD-dependent deacetylase|nr:NAD-dependent deacylase [Fibromonadaceae bacterium]